MTRLSAKIFFDIRIFLTVTIIVMSGNIGYAVSEGTFSPGKTSFSIKVKDEIFSYSVLGVFVLPGQTLTIEAIGPDKDAYFIFKSDHGSLVHSTSVSWNWKAPVKSGLYPVEISKPRANETIQLNVFVMIPFSQLKGEYLKGYHIGKYPAFPLKNLSIYKPPSGFIEVTTENEDTLVSPHFKLKQFLCKQKGGYPKYIVLREKLLLKLELVLGEVNDKGYTAQTLHVMSGYRTPFYNGAIGNVKYSRHVYGGAADIFIDENPKDGMMDDLNKDGKTDYKDAAVVYDIIDGLYGKPWYEIFTGGLGRYRKTADHGPFVHVDVRGFRARWGN